MVAVGGSLAWPARAVTGNSADEALGSRQSADEALGSRQIAETRP